MPEFVLYIVAKNEKRPHITDQVHPASVQEHATEEGEYFVRSELLDEDFRHKPEILEKNGQSVVAKRHLEKENKHIDRNDQVRDERN